MIKEFKMPKKRNIHGFDHVAVNRSLEGELTYLGDLRLQTGVAVAVYKASNPNRSKGHKDYVLLTPKYVSGMDESEFETHTKQEAVLCTECGQVLTSLWRHDYNTCECPNEAMIDGGGDYLRCGAKNMLHLLQGTFDFLANTFTARL